MHERIQALAEIGQSLWFDYIRRGMIASGELQQLVDDGIVGVTSNPTILQKAISESDDYDEALAELVAAGKSGAQVYEAFRFDLCPACRRAYSAELRAGRLAGSAAGESED